MPIRPNVLWAVDLQFDQTSNGKTLKLLNVIDEFTRECPDIEVARNIDADGVVSCLERIAAERGAPMYLRFDNGPEFIAHAVADWCRFNSTRTVFIDPGSPWQNAWIESFNGRLCDEFLNSHRFDSLIEAQVLIDDWRIDYNMNRPHSAHGCLSPNEFARQWTNRHQPQLTKGVDQLSGSPHIRLTANRMVRSSWRSPSRFKRCRSGATRRHWDGRVPDNIANAASPWIRPTSDHSNTWSRFSVSTPASAANHAQEPSPPGSP